MRDELRVVRVLALACVMGLGITLYVESTTAAPAPASTAAQKRVEDAYAAMGWAEIGRASCRERVCNDV